jgi:hypothetical protein
MSDPALAIILDEALALLDAGEEPESIVARFPDFTASLLPLLRLASTLKETADEAVDVPIEALRDIGEFLQEQFQEVFEP